MGPTAEKNTAAGGIHTPVSSGEDVPLAPTGPSLSERSLGAVLWVFVDKLGASSLNFAVSILLARLLAPEDFGLLAMVMVFFELSAVFVESGFSTALIRQPAISEDDKSTTFLFNLFSALVLYVALFAGAPAIAAFFHQPDLLWIVRVMGINLLINAFSIVQHAAFTHDIDFKSLTKVRFAGVFLSGAAAVIAALSGLGVWSLVIRFGLMALIETIALWVLNPWRIRWRFSRASFRRLFAFGANILAAALLHKFFVHVYKLIIGRFFAAATLGFYTQAGTFTNMVINTLFHTIQNVTYPVLAKLQDDRERLREGYRKMLKLSSFVMAPAMVVLAVLARPLVVALIGEKWLPSVPMLQLLCLSGITYHLSAINLNMLLVLGRADLSLRLEVVKKVNIAIAILIGLRFGIYGLIVGEVISAYVNLLINAYYSDKFLGYSLIEQVRDILPTAAFSLLAGGLLIVLRDVPASPGLVHLAAGASIALALYLALHLLARTEEMALLRRTIIPGTMKLILGKTWKS